MATTISSKDRSTQPAAPSSNGEGHGLSHEASQANFWRSSAPKRVNQDEKWDAWMQYLPSRSTPKSLENICRSQGTPLLWGLDLEQFGPSTKSLFELYQSLLAKPHGERSQEIASLEDELAQWLQTAEVDPQGVDFALDCLVVANALPMMAENMDPETWWKLADRLWQVVEQSSQWRIDVELPPEQGLAQQIFTGELPLTLAYLLPEIRPLHKLRKAAGEALSEGLVELLNGEGLVHGSYLPVMRPLLASWTRCRSMAGQLKKSCWSREAESQFKWLTTQAIRWTAADGQQLLGPAPGLCWEPDFLQQLFKLGGDKADFAAAQAILNKKLTRSLGGSGSGLCPEPADNCEWSSLAVMRTDWQSTAPTVAIDYSTPDLRFEVHAGRQRLFSGVWGWQTSLDEKPLDPVGPWEEVCWFSDDDVDFLELSIDLAKGARLERQILLAREDWFLLLVDYVVDTAGGRLCHRQSLPLDEAVRFDGEEDTRDALLSVDKPIARVMPLALPEWRIDPRVGSLSSSGGQLQLEQQQQGRNIACPLFFDLQKRRVPKQSTWRQLTVAESLEIQPAEVAVGYRVQSAKRQWMIYRSLAAKANRTLMGQNTSSECLVARFLSPAGELDELLEVEG